MNTDTPTPASAPATVPAEGEQVTVPAAMLRRVLKAYDDLASLAEIVACGCDPPEPAGCEACNFEGYVNTSEEAADAGEPAEPCEACTPEESPTEEHRCADYTDVQALWAAIGGA